VSGWEQPIAVEDIFDWEKSTTKLAGQAPWWKPGTASGYHAFNQGHLVGEVIRRITGMRLGEFFAAEIAGPLNADFHIGLAPKHFSRIANVIPPPPLPFDFDTMDKESAAYKTLTGPRTDASRAWTDAWRRADIGAANGHGNARSVANLQALVACGGKVDGVRLLSPATCELALQEQANGVDLVLGQPIRFGIGYGLPHESLPHIPPGRICWWGGWGGSLIVVDQARRMTVAYVMNRMGPGTLGDTRGAGFLNAAISAADRG
jgi:CubicO group peptidase (beta-lactamase class C family)